MSTRRRFLADSVRGDAIELGPSESHHLANVLRLGRGDEVEVFDGAGNAARARVERISTERVELLRLGDAPSRESPLEIRVALALLKGDKMAYAVQKLTEIGVSVIAPVVSERAEGDAGKGKSSLERWSRIALSAAKQCGRSRVPALEQARPLEEVLDDSTGPIFMLEPSAELPLPSVSADKGCATVVIGPEGGWSSDELRLAKRRDLTPFSLGPRVLRSETAAIAAASLLQWRDGDWAGSPRR